ncbi:MAG: phosphopyruvate hydratase [Lachnospiraceae bacterium]|nr:phosphopyruvate hydratase [Lachnospiraceae bacterium]MDD3615128.1 phosphopyruvate hydratase [Lachnospiraceae bacterium]
MFRYLPIRRVYAREVLDSRGNPTVEVEVTVGENIVGIYGSTGRAMVPSGASTGKYEAIELRDGDKRYRGKGVTKAVHHVNTILSDILVGENALNQSFIDQILIQEDGSANKVNLGANAILGVSMAVAKAAAKALCIPLYQYLGGCYTNRIPIPMMNILNGGCHADNNLDFQEFMIVPQNTESFSRSLQMCEEVYQELKEILKQRHLSTGVGDEGGFAPEIADAKEALKLIITAIEQSGYTPGKDLCIAMDAAASELYDADRKVYYFPGESTKKGKEIFRTSQELIGYYEELSKEFPIISIEDGLGEEDWDGWKVLSNQLADRVLLVGDDLFVTNPKKIQRGISEDTANAVLIKVNQIGTLTEALQAIYLAQKNGYEIIVSHRSGETEDAFIADLAVACRAGYIKAGAPCRSERNAKYNQLLRIEEVVSRFKSI